MADEAAATPRLQRLHATPTGNIPHNLFPRHEENPDAHFDHGAFVTLSRIYYVISISVAIIAVVANDCVVMGGESTQVPFSCTGPTEDLGSTEFSWMDPSFVDLSDENIKGLCDKITKSPFRLVAIINMFVAVFFLLQSHIEIWFLGEGTPQIEDLPFSVGGRFGFYLIFKFGLVATVVSEDGLDWLILLSWYTTLFFLHSLSHLCNGKTLHTIQSGQNPRPGVLYLLFMVLVCDGMAASFFLSLVHKVEEKLFVIMCDSLLLALDALCHILKHLGQVDEARHAKQISDLEEERQRLDDLWEKGMLEKRIVALGKSHGRRSNMYDTTIYFLQLFTHVLTVLHFVRAWSFQGFSLTLLDAVLVVQVYSVLSSGSKLIVERNHQNKLTELIDSMFEEASETEKATAGNYCCVCYEPMALGPAKKLRCNHVYHTSCLRRVIMSKRSIEAASCPICREPLLVDRRSSRPPNSVQRVDALGQANAVLGTDPGIATVDQVRNAASGANAANVGERALFRFTTEGLFPSWLPLSEYSFEVVRRPPVRANDNRNANPNHQVQNDTFERIGWLVLQGIACTLGRIWGFVKSLLEAAGVFTGRLYVDDQQ